MREIVFDTETTGLDPKTGDRLVEIGCIELVNRVPTGRTFHAYFNPERSMPIDACGHPCISLDRMIDTLAIARRRHPGAKHSLDALCTRYGIDRSHRVRHGALLDAELLAQVYVELTGGRQIGLQLVAEKVETVVQVASFMPARREFRPPRPHAASAEELARHKAFVETLDSSLWAS